MAAQRRILAGVPDLSVTVFPDPLSRIGIEWLFAVSVPPCQITPMTEPGTDTFTAAEREFIRREFGQRFGSFPALAEGIFLRRWRTGPQAGQAKIPTALAGLIQRGLVALSPEPPSILGTRAYFTPAGLAALRELLQDRRAMDPERFAHLRQELGLDQTGAEVA